MFLCCPFAFNVDLYLCQIKREVMWFILLLMPEDSGNLFNLTADRSRLLADLASFRVHVLIASLEQVTPSRCNRSKSFLVNLMPKI